MPYGVSQQQWNMLSQDERNDIIAQETGAAPAGPSAAKISASTPTSALPPSAPGTPPPTAENPPPVPNPIPGPAGSDPNYKPPGDPNYKPPGSPDSTPSSTKTAPPPVDWASSFFASLGLPPDVIAQVNKIFTQYTDVNAASAAALGYIRGTSWYATTYPGIAAGIQKGLFGDEAGYRSLLNQQSQLYKQYLGRDVTSSEFAANLGEGASLSTIGNRLQGTALANTYGNDWRYTLGAFDQAPTDAEVQALGQESAGLDTPLGQQVKRRLDLAQQRLQGVFQGTLQSGGLSLINGRPAATGLASKPDLAA